VEPISWILLGFLSYIAVALVVLLTSFWLREQDGGYIRPANADVVALFWPGIVVGAAMLAFLYPLDRLHTWVRRSR
jgi:ABC-type spermidine/putrescine transport system permease subunit II